MTWTHWFTCIKVLQNICMIIDLTDLWVVRYGDSGESKTTDRHSWILLCFVMVGKIGGGLELNVGN